MLRTTKATMPMCIYMTLLWLGLATLYFCMITGGTHIALLMIFGSNANVNIVVAVALFVTNAFVTYYMCRTVFRYVCLYLDIWRCKKLIDIGIQTLCTLEIERLDQTRPFRSITGTMQSRLVECSNMLSFKKYNDRSFRLVEGDDEIKREKPKHTIVGNYANGLETRIDVVLKKMTEESIFD